MYIPLIAIAIVAAVLAYLYFQGQQKKKNNEEV